MTWKLITYGASFVLLCISLPNIKADEFTTTGISITLSKNLNVDLGRGRNFRFGFAAKVDKTRSDKKISGTNLWKISAWFSSSENGAGDTVGFFDQTLNSAQSGLLYKKSVRLTINGISYRLPPMQKQCSDVRYFCVRFGATDSPQLQSGRSLDVNGFPDDSALTKCVEPARCIENSQICFEDGMIYDDGVTWKPYPCTECTCTSGGVICHVEDCQTSCAVKYQIHTIGVCCPTCPTSCQGTDGNTYDIGSSWKIDTCTNCTCLANGNTECYATDCVLPSCPGGQQLIHHSEVCCAQCPLECGYNGDIHVHLEQWNSDVCTSCNCFDGTIQCEVEMCPPLSCSESTRIKAGGQCCAECAFDCVHLDEVYQHGTSWRMDVCTACVCNNGEHDCVVDNCALLSCHAEQTITRRGECCAVCGEVCEDNGVIHVHGELWSRDVCTTCNCTDGSSVCDVELCPPLDCDVITQLKSEDQCCAECALECLHGGTVYQHGASWSPDVCTTCSCDDGAHACVLENCPLTPCIAEQTLTRTGECCAVCGEECLHEGTLYQHGASWSQDVCTTCSCDDGAYVCVIENCPDTPCLAEQTLTRTGECCAVCGEECLHEGTAYQHGASWSPDVCTECSCDDGVYDCVLENCPVTTCLAEQTLTRTGECCAVCGDECLDEGTAYQHGASWSPDVCTSCSCHDGAHACLVQNCLVTRCPAEHTLRRTGECCAVCGEGCTSNGGDFNHLARWSPDTCTSCVCEDGIDMCVSESCGVPDCDQHSRPVTLEGECCASCSKGPPLILLSNMVKIKFGKNTKLKLGAKKSKLNFTPIINFENADTAVTGSNLWNISAWLSSEENGNSKLARKHNTLSNKQSSTGLSPNQRLNLGSTKVKFTIRKPKCKRIKYVCIRFDLTENPLSDGVTLFLDPNSIVQTCARVPTCRDFRKG